MFGSPTPVPTPTTDYVQNLKETLEKSYQLARVRMGLSLKRQKDLYDQRIHGHPYQPGDLVWLHCPAVPKGCSKKLYRPWKGPFRVLRTIGNTTYHIKDVKSPRKKVYVHFNRLKPYSGYEQQATNTTSCAPHPPTVENPDLNTRSPPVGSHLTLLEPDVNIQVPPPVSRGNSSVQPLPVSNPQAGRYPQRSRRPPGYYHNHV